MVFSHLAPKLPLYKPAKVNDCDGDLKKRWYVFYSILDEDGKYKLHKNYSGINTITSADARHLAANRIADEINQELAAKFGDAFNAKPIYLLDALDIVMKSKAILRTKSQSTYRSFIHSLQEHLKNSKIKTDQFTKSMALEYLDKIANTGIGARTYNNYLTFTRTIFNELKQREFITVNPFLGIKKLRSTPQTHSIFSEVEQSEAANYMRLHEPGLFLFVQFVFYCFIRPYELTQLKVSSVDLKRKALTIPGKAAKNGKTQTVMIPAAFWPEIEGMNLDGIYKNHYLIGSGFVPGPIQLKRDTATKKHREVMDILNFRRELTLYSWKHTGAVRSVLAGVNLKELQLQLRHHSLEQVDMYLRDLGLTQRSELPRIFPSIN